MISRWIDDTSMTHIVPKYCALPSTTKSTICLSFSPTGRTFASSHGDHTVKIITYPRGNIIRTLIGHPRTPWVVKFHPTNSNLVASACLSFQVRLWNISEGKCGKMCILTATIFSLSFHPTQELLAIGSADGLYIWRYALEDNPVRMYVQQVNQLRCAVFHPRGEHIIIGETTEPPENIADNRSGIFSLKLTMWKFAMSGMLSNPVLIVKHAVAYNDGGFDVSSDGRYLVAFVYYSDDDVVRDRDDSMNMMSCSSADGAMSPGTISSENNIESPVLPVPSSHTEGVNSRCKYIHICVTLYLSVRHHIFIMLCNTYNVVRSRLNLASSREEPLRHFSPFVLLTPAPTSHNFHDGTGGSFGPPPLCN